MAKEILFGTLSVSYIRTYLLKSLKGVKPEDLPDSKIEGFIQDFGDKGWQAGFQAAKQNIRGPIKKMEKKEKAVSVLFLQSKDRGKTDNVHDKYCLLEDNTVITIKDEGVCKLKPGTIYSIPCSVASIEGKGDVNFIRIPHEKIKKVTTVKEEDVLARLELAKTDLLDLEKSEYPQPAVIAVKLTHKLGPMSGKPLYSTEESGDGYAGFNFYIFAIQESTDTFITAFFNPQRFGTPHEDGFVNIFYDGFFKDTLPHTMDDDEMMKDLLQETIIPVPDTIPTYIVGSYKVKDEVYNDEERVSRNINVAGMWRNLGELPEFEGVEPEDSQRKITDDTDITEVLPEIEEIKMSDDSEEIEKGEEQLNTPDMDFVKKIVKMNPGIGLSNLNDILKNKGQKATQLDLDTVKDELGITLEEKLEPVDDGICKATKKNGEPCEAKAKDNGFCGRHQGVA